MTQVLKSALLNWKATSTRPEVAELEANSTVGSPSARGYRRTRNRRRADHAALVKCSSYGDRRNAYGLQECGGAAAGASKLYNEQRVTDARN